jgi:hypothetical protein
MEIELLRIFVFGMLKNNGSHISEYMRPKDLDL